MNPRFKKDDVVYVGFEDGARRKGGVLFVYLYEGWSKNDELRTPRLHWGTKVHFPCLNLDYHVLDDSDINSLSSLFEEDI